MKISVTGIKPTGTPHLGNYLGMIQPALELAAQTDAIYFIADYHALTTMRDPGRLRVLTHEVAATWLALGLDPARTILYRQSDLPEVCELSWLLSCLTPKGLLNRAHAYKSAVDHNRAGGKDPDAGVNVGFFSYPVLMAADVLVHQADVVPIGLDQKQHVEVARDLAEAFNRAYGPAFRVPEPLIREEVQTIPGADGRKMSKSCGNVIPLFARPEELRRRVSVIVTDSKRPEEPKDPDTCNVFALLRHLAPTAEVADVRRRYIDGGIGYRDAKEMLFEALALRFSRARQRYDHLMADTTAIESVLADGAERARFSARPTLEVARRAVGVGVHDSS